MPRAVTGNESLFQQAAQPLVGLGADDIHVAELRIVIGEGCRSLVAAEQLRVTGIELLWLW